MPSSLTFGRYVICGVDDAGRPAVVNDGGVYERDGTIVEIGDHRELLDRHHPDACYGSRDHVVMPGLVNSHHHVGLTPFQMGSPDLPLELWTVDRFRKRDVDPYLDTLYSAFEMIESGVTTVQHLHSRAGGNLEQLYRTAAAVIRAYKALGMRVSYSFGVRDQNRLVHERDEMFLKHLPSPLAADAKRLLEAQRVPLSETLALFEQLHRDYARDPLVRIQVAPINLTWCSDRALESVRDLSERYGVPMHMHLLETVFQREYGKRRNDAGSIRHLRDLGLLGPRLTLGHCVWASEEELDLLADTGTRVCHNASSNLRLRSGVAPIRAIQKRGIEIALGIDEAGINDDRDMLQEMRLVLRIHRRPGFADDVPTAGEVLRMATSHGARTTPFGDAIGRLAPGGAADMSLLKWAAISSPYLDAGTQTVHAVVYRGKREAVDMVIVGGVPIYRNGAFTRVSKSDAFAEIRASLDVPLHEEELWRQRVAGELLPYVKRYYEAQYPSVV